MKKINNNFIDPFYALYNVIDLHGFDKEYALFKVNEFINDSLKLKKYDLIIIHGKGTGVLKNSIHELLKNDKRVIEYKIDNYNDGQTIVRLGEINEK